MTTLTQALYDRLAERIRNGDLRPGQELPSETDLMEQTGVSRVTVRRAYDRLVNDGLVVANPGRLRTVALAPVSMEPAADLAEFYRREFNDRLESAAIELRMIATQLDRIREDPSQDAVAQALAVLDELSQVLPRVNVEALVRAAFHAACSGVVEPES